MTRSSEEADVELALKEAEAQQVAGPDNVENTAVLPVEHHAYDHNGD